MARPVRLLPLLPLLPLALALSACGRSEPAPQPGTEAAARPGAGPAEPKPGEDLQVWFVGWFEHLATASETAVDCAHVATAWGDMAERARPHFAKIKQLEAAQTDEQKRAWATANGPRLQAAQVKVQAAIERCKDDAGFQRTMETVLSLL